MSHIDGVVKAKPIEKRILKRLPEFHQPRDFVRASKASQDEFYKGNQVSSAKLEKKAVGKSLTNEERNKIAAKILRAEMLGQMDLVQKFKQQLENSSPEASVSPKKETDSDSDSNPCDSEACSSTKRETVLLTKTDFRSGITYPVYNKHTASSADGRSRKKRKECDDTKDFSIRDMLELEKFTTAEDQLSMFGGVVAKNTDDAFDIDDDFPEKMVKKQKSKHESVERSEFNQVVKAHRKLEQTLENCPFCIDSKKLQKHLIVSLGLKTYLAIPSHQPLVEFQCRIVPMCHVSSCVQMDEDIYAEMRIGRKGLVAMFRQRDLDVVFKETAKNVRHQPHAHVECYAVPLKIGDIAPMYFKKALLECEEEWAQNKKIIDLSKKDLQKSIPRGFSYFAVDFGLQNGYAHVIESESNFGTYFGHEIIGGMLDLDANLWRQPPKQNFQQQNARVNSLKTMWEPYDWTERIRQRLQEKQ